MPSLTVTEAQARAASLAVSAYDVELDLTRDAETFGSRTVIEFESRDGQDTFLDISPRELLSAHLNERALDVSELRDGRLQLTGLAPSNVLVVDAVMAYSNDGEGLHRAVDPEDGVAYVYAMTFLPAAPRIFACFDQPDLKATYRISASAPEEWTVVGNGRATQTAPGRWTLAETKPVSTYLVTLVAGPYYSVTTTHDGITLGLHCRQSLAPHLDKDSAELFEVTGRCLDEYHRLFGIRYPFGDYHQAFVPEFNAGAMENPGCVTFTDEFVFKAQATDSMRATRAYVVAHEMAHQWFGDLVTMQWWDDLWLNESFATYMGYRLTSEVTSFDDIWVEFSYNEKAWGLAADQRSSTHPVAGNGAEDTQQALTEFDGISYSKGAGALRQLQAYLGDETFLAGVVDHLQRHSYANATLADLLDSWQRSSHDGKDVHAWAQKWLRTAGVDTLRCVADSDGVVVERLNGSVEDVSRPHAITVTWYRDDATPESVPVVVSDDRTPVPLPGYDGTGLLLPDSRDETWAKIGLDDASVQRAPGYLERIDDPLGRAVIWAALREGMLDARVDPEQYLRAVETALHGETDLGVEKVLGSVHGGLIGQLAVLLTAPDDRNRLTAVAAQLLAGAKPSSNRQVVAARALVAVSDDDQLLRAWLDGQAPEGLRVDEDLRWRVTRALCELGVFGAAEIDAEQARDRSSQGAEYALRCRATVPDAASKQDVWTSITSDHTLSNYDLCALCEYFFRPGQLELTEPYVERYFTEIPGTASFRSGALVDASVKLAFPRFAVSDRTLQLAEQTMARNDLTPGVRRGISDGADDLRRALRVRARYAGQRSRR
jgi:aminopeptidase N